MAVLKKYNLKGEAIGEVAIDDKLVETTVNSQLIKDYLTAIRANRRQWSANTRGRAEVNHSGQKPHPQKGMGRARQGCLAAPQYKGGGRVHAPKPKFDQHVRINRKERKAAVKHLLSEKIGGQRIHVLEYEPLKTPKTKAIADFLSNSKIAGKRVLFLAEGAAAPVAKGKKKAVSAPEKYNSFVKSMGNIQKLEFMLLPNVSGHDIALSHDIVVMQPAVDELMILLGG